jgi:transposase
MNREEREAGIERAAAEARQHRRRRSNRPLPNHLDRRVHSHHRHLRGFVRTSAGAEVDYASDITERLSDHRGDYERHGTINLFAALNVKTGTVISEFHRRHRATEFRNFLETIDAAVTAGFELHLILDNYGTHKTPIIKRWLLRHLRFHLHFTPTGASWLNLVERLFGLLTEKQLRRGVPQHSGIGRCHPRFPSNTTTVILNASYGPKPPTESWNRLADFVNAFLAQESGTYDINQH